MQSHSLEEGLRFVDIRALGAATQQSWLTGKRDHAARALRTAGIIDHCNILIPV